MQFNRIMTLANRNRIILGSLLFSTISGGLVFFLLLSKTSIQTIRQMTAFDKHSFWWWISSTSIVGDHILWTLITSAFLVFFGLVFTILLFYFFRKTTSPEIFFFNAFLLCLSTQSLKILQIILITRNFSFIFGILLTRFLLFFYFSGIFLFFTGSLFATGFPYQRFSLSFSAALGAAFLFSYFLPIDGTILQTNLIYSPSAYFPTGAVVIFVELLTVINFIRGSFYHNSREYLFLSLGAFLSIIGFEFLFFIASPIMICCGLIFLILGGGIFINKTFNLYLWV